MKIEATPVFSGPVNRDGTDFRPDPTVVQASEPQVVTSAGRPPEIRKEDLNRMVEKMNTTMKIFNHALQFRVSQSGRVIITVFDANSGEVIRQIPPEALTEAFDHVDKVLGLLVDRKV